MGKNRRTSSNEFKPEAACLVVDQGYSMTEASRSLDVGETGLRR
jgi:transposase